MKYCQNCGEEMQNNESICPVCHEKYVGIKRQMPKVESGDSNRRNKHGLLIGAVAAVAILVVIVLLFGVPYNAKTGLCGPNLRWKMNTKTGELTISGTGHMEYSWGSGAPWEEYSNVIRRVEISQGVTSIGAQAFIRYPVLTEVIIPDSVITIEGAAFSGCDLLSTVYYGGTPEQWSEINIHPHNEQLITAAGYEQSSVEEMPGEIPATGEDVEEDVTGSSDDAANTEDMVRDAQSDQEEVDIPEIGISGDLRSSLLKASKI